MSMPQLCWDVELMKNNPTLQDGNYGISAEARHTGYPVRYWPMYHFLREGAARKGPLDVCEIGVDVGQMLGFMHAAAGHGGGERAGSGIFERSFFDAQKGFFLENYRWWLRFNLWFGALFPSWPGELYWVLRKPSNN